MYDLGEIIKKLRQERGYSQEKLAEKINKSKSSVSKYESNQKSPPLETLIDLSILFNVSLDYLAGIEKGNSILINNLTKEQLSIINTILIEFHSKKPQAYNKRMSKRQMELLNDLISEFLL